MIFNLIVDLKTIKKIANLARIELSDEEEKLYASQLENVLDYFRLLNEADTSSVNLEESADSALCVKMREDKEAMDRKFNKKMLIENIPETENEFVKVKGVFKE